MLNFPRGAGLALGGSTGSVAGKGQLALFSALVMTNACRLILILCRALWGSWVQGLDPPHFFDCRKQPSFSFHDIS